MKIRITALRKTSYPDLMAKYENPIEHTCDVMEGQEWISIDGWMARKLHVESSAGGTFHPPVAGPVLHPGAVGGLAFGRVAGNRYSLRTNPTAMKRLLIPLLALLESLREANPQAQFYIARMTPLGASHYRLLTGNIPYHRHIQHAIETVARESGARLIDFYEPLIARLVLGSNTN